MTLLTERMLRTLYEAEEDERFVRRSRLRVALGDEGRELEDTRLNGVMGKFGMRVRRTEGYVDGTSYFETKRAEDNGEWRYRLPDHLRDVVGKILDGYGGRADRAQTTDSSSDAKDEL